MVKPARFQNRIELLQGTLDLLVLRTLQWGPQHGYGIAQAIKSNSSDVLAVDTGSLYPALHRLERQKLIASSWKVSDNRQRTKVYRMTAAGKRHLSAERSRWERLVDAMGGILNAPRPEEILMGRRRNRDAELDEELHSHLAMATRDRIERGEAPDAAAAAARREFGNMRQVQEATRDAWGRRWVSQLGQDLRVASRTLWRSPFFALVTIATIALGISATTTAFTVVNAVLLRPLPFADADQLLRIWSAMLERGDSRATSSMPDYRAMRADTRTLESLGAYTSTRFNLTDTGEPERLEAARASASLFRTLRVEPLIGRPMEDADEVWGQHHVALVSERLWRSRFGANRDVVGRVLLLDDQPYEVVGVLPALMQLPETSADVWVPLSYAPDSSMNTRGNYVLHLIGRRRAGVSEAAVTADLAAALTHAKADVGVAVMDLRGSIVGDVSATLQLLLATTVVVLLIACANVASLLLARTMTRVPELAARAALGASSGRLMRQLLTESLLLSVCGGLVGFMLANVAVGLVRTYAPPDVPRLDTVAIDWQVGIVVVLGTFASGLLFGAMSIRRALTAVAQPLRDVSRGGTAGRAHVQAREVLVVAEIAMTLVLVVATSMLLLGFVQLAETPLGFTPDGVFTARLDFPEARYPDAAMPGVADALVQRVAALPGVSVAGVATALPLTPTGWGKLLTVQG